MFYKILHILLKNCFMPFLPNQTSSEADCKYSLNSQKTPHRTFPSYTALF